MKARSQSGNMLVYILGAVFLLGILFVAMRSGYQPGAGIDAEGAILKATQIRKYGNELERGVTFIMQNGRSETDIRFAHVSNPGYGTVGDTPPRQVFEPNGGGVEWKAPPSGTQSVVTQWAFLGTTGVDGVGSTCGTAACSDLVAILHFLTKEICMALNDSIGITNPSGDAPEDINGWGTTPPFQGTFEAAPSLISTTGDHTKYKKEGCVKTGTVYDYYRVLLAR